MMPLQPLDLRSRTDTEGPHGAPGGTLAAPLSSKGLNEAAHGQQPPEGGPGAQSAALPAPTPVEGYAGDVPGSLAWQWVQSGAAVLVDVRSDAEREWVGSVPGAAAVAWKQWPGMALNPDFDAQLRAAVPPGRPVVLLCRSGVRSVAAARRATELGLTAYNILEGFEGALDGQGQRGHLGGWRWQGLPWRQG